MGGGELVGQRRRPPRIAKIDDRLHVRSMHVPFLNLAAQHDSLKDELLPLVEETLASGRYILGPNVAALEAEVAALVGVQYGVGVNSGSHPLTLPLPALETRPGPHVPPPP